MRNATTSWHERSKVILRASKQHATNLAKFVAIYKSLLLLQRKLNGGKGRPHDSFFAGLLGGYLVFGERNAINEQVRTAFVTTVSPPPPLHPFVRLCWLLLCAVRTRRMVPCRRRLFGFQKSNFSMIIVLRQIVLYVCSRVLASFIPRARSPHAPVTAGSGTVKPIPPDSRYFSVFAAITWGAVMWLFQHRGETIQPGMFNSMTYLYEDSERWQNLRTLLWYNR